MRRMVPAATMVGVAAAVVTPAAAEAALAVTGWPGTCGFGRAEVIVPSRPR